jgi:cysteine synthase A
MTKTSPLNVYSGPRALQDYFDPDAQPMLPLIELPASLNPFLDDGVHIFAKMFTALPAQNVKALPGKEHSLSFSPSCYYTETTRKIEQTNHCLTLFLALNMIQNAPSAAKKPVVEASSGSTVISLALASRVMNQNDDVTAYVTNKTELSRLQTLAFFGIKL